MKDVRTDKSVI